MKPSYVLVALVVILLVVAAFAVGFFVGRTYAPLAAAYSYGPGGMMGRGGGYGMMPGYRPGFGMMGRFGRGFGLFGGFLPGLGWLAIGWRFFMPLALLALIVLVVILLVRKRQPATVAPTTANPPVETKQV